jgi:hypothetical protein
MSWHRRRTLFAALLCAATSGCASREEAARDTFATAFTCPVDRVTVTKVDGVRWSEVMKREHPIPAAPADIRSDPQRLAKWKEDHNYFSEGFDRYHRAFRVNGCGHAVEYLCQCPFDAPAWKQMACVCDKPNVPLVPGTQPRGVSE